MNEYNLIVWYRYMSNGEQEKDYKYFTIVAESLEKAKEMALDTFRMRSSIPFKIDVQ
jgi:hypothetical protein